MSNNSNFRERVSDMRKQFCTNNPGKEPTKLYLTDVDKTDVYQLEEGLSAATRKQLHTNGPEEVFPKILGMTVIYGANDTYVA